MAIKVVLELGEEDLAYYRQVMDSIWQRNKKRAEKELIAGARRLLKQATKQKAPEFVLTRLADLEALCAMLDDAEWPLEADDRNRVLAAVGYFAVANDMIPDKIPGIGFLDDALMAELVARELEPELAGYREFCEYRDGETRRSGKKNVTREDWLAAKRRQIWLRIRRRQQERRRHGSPYLPTDPILRYQY